MHKVIVGTALVGAVALVGCGGTSATTASMHHAVSAKAACQDLAKWENSGGNALLQDDPVSTKIMRESAGTRFGADFANWIKALKTKSDTTAAVDRVSADCNQAGVPGAINGGTPTAQVGTVVRICQDIDYWYNFGNNSAIPHLMKESARTKVGTDFAAWIKIWKGTDTSAINAAAARLAADCAKAGVTSLQADMGTGGSSGGSGSSTPQPTTSSPSTSPSPKPRPQTVTYVVSGSGADVTYGPAGTELQGSVPMDVTNPLGSPAYYAINAQLQGGGTVSCAIEVDGHAISTATASGGYNIATCEIVQDPVSGQWVNANG